jgi:hypothetical protein
MVLHATNQQPNMRATLVPESQAASQTTKLNPPHSDRVISPILSCSWGFLGRRPSG